jgi:hypothetical protein
VYGQGWRLGRAVRELGGRVGALALEIAGGNRRVADAYGELALDYLAAVDLRRFGAGDDEHLIRLAMVAIWGAHSARKERLQAVRTGLPTGEPVPRTADRAHHERVFARCSRDALLS